MTFILLFAPPIISALLALIVRSRQEWIARISALLSLISIGASLAFASQALLGGQAPTFGPHALLRADSLSALLLICVSSVASLALFIGSNLGHDYHWEDGQFRRYLIFVNLFIAMMLLAVTANNVGVMWVAIEATTIFSAMVIPLTLTKASIEASWKYILIGSTGIALAFAGTVLAYFDFVNLAGPVEDALNWPVLISVAPVLHPEIIRMAFVLLLIGYGTKAGLAPMHTWLPDAHAEAPAPLSALMSGVLLAVATYAILRWKAVVDVVLGPGFTDHLLIALGLLSIAIAAFSLVIQRNYKRMLAYSSIEHTGLICLGLGLGPLGIFAALLLLISHSAAKSMLFFLAGNILHRYNSTKLAEVSGLLKTMPWTGGLFAAALLALIGLPPFGLFVAELALFQAGFAKQYQWLMVVVIALVTIVFISMVKHLHTLLYGPVPESIEIGERFNWRNGLLLLNIGVLTVLGIALPVPLVTLLNQIVGTLSK
jgi:hydrogenase-4 component F